MIDKHLSLNTKNPYFLFGIGLVIFVFALLFINYGDKSISKAWFGSSYAYAAKSSGLDIKFANRREGQELIRVTDDVSRTGLSLKVNNSTNSQINPKLSGEQENKKLVYEEVYAGVNIAYELIEQGVKEDIVIGNKASLYNDAGNPVEFIFNLSLDGIKPQELDDGVYSTEFYDSSGKMVMRFLPPFMVDASGVESDEVKLLVTKDESGEYQVEVIPDLAWLIAEERVYPVTVDPTVVKGNAPLAEWKMDEGYGTTTADDSGNGNDLTITNATWERTGDMSGTNTNYIEFDGTTDYLSRDSETNFDFGTGSFTISGWFKHNSTAATSMLIARHDTGLGGAGWKVYMDSSGYLCFAVDDDNTWDPDYSACTTSGLGSLADSKWHNFTAVKSATSTITLYLDGLQAAQTSIAGLGSLTGNSGTTVYLGIDSDGSNNAWTGFLDHIIIFDYARSAAQVKADTLHPQTAAHFGSEVEDSLTNGLVGWWKLNESSGNASDSSGNATTLTDGSSTTYAQGKFGNGADLELGSTDYLYAADNATLSLTGDLTISAWINPESVTAATLFDIAGKFDGASEAYQFSQYEDEIRLYIDSSNDYATTDSANLTTGTWYHVVGSYKAASQTVTLYVNGQISASTVTGTIPGSIGDDGARFHLGAEDSTGGVGTHYDGIVDEVRVYNRVLQPREVEQLSKWGAPPIAYYSFDENTGTGASAVKDRSGNGNDGTMQSSMIAANWAPGKYGSGMKFDGINDYVSVSDANILDLSDFTINMWFKPDGTYTTTSDYVNGLIDKGSYKVFLDKSDGKARSEVTNGTTSFATSRDGSDTGIHAFAVYQDKLYAGNRGPSGDTGEGDVLVFDGTSWTISYNGTERGIISLAVYNGNLYAGQGGAQAGDGKVFQYDGSSWTTSYDGGGTYHGIGSLAVYNGKLYAGTQEGSNIGDVLVFDGSSWTVSYDGAAAYEVINSLAVYNNKLYAGTSYGLGDGDVIVFDGSSWSLSYNGAAITNIPGLAVYLDGLFAGRGIVTDDGDIQKFNGSSWSISDDSTGYENVLSLVIYDGKLYAGMGFNDGDADIRVFDGSSWATHYNHTGSINNTQALVVYRGDLYSGTSGGSGEGDILVRNGGGAVASTTTSWNGFQHVSVVKNGTTLDIYVNGVKQSSTTLDSTTTEANTKNLLIGRLYGTRGTGTGEGFFKGVIDDVRIYNYARNQDQVIQDMNAGHPVGGSPVGSPVGYWKFDEGYGTTAQDASTYNNDLTLTTATGSWTSDGKYGFALNDTGSDWAYRNDDDDFDFAAADGFTISLWARSDSASNPGTQEYLLAKFATSGTYEPGYAIYFNTSGYPIFGIDDDSTWGPDDTATISTDYYDNQWHHLAATKTATSNIKLYVDGILRNTNSSMTALGSLANSQGLKIGDDNAGTGNGLLFNGDIDEVKIYRTALTADQIKLEYNRGKSTLLGSQSTDTSGNADWSARRELCPPGNTEGNCGGSNDPTPVGWWTFDENTGTGSNAVKDHSGNANHGTMEASMTTSDWVPGPQGSSLDFDGNDDEVSVAYSSELDVSSAVSVEAWIKYKSLAVDQGIIGKWDPGSNERSFYFGSDWSNSDELIVQLDQDGLFGNTYQPYSTNANLASNTWYHVAFSWSNANDISIYKNGVKLTTTTHSGSNPSSINTGNTAVYLGAIANGNQNADIVVADLRMYDYVRTPAQVAWTFNRGKPVGWWKMDDANVDAEGETSNDSSGNGNNGTLYGDNGVGDNGSGMDCTVTGKFNTACDFDGTDDYVEISDNSLLDLYDDRDYSWSFWVYPNGFTQWSTAWSQLNSTSSYFLVYAHTTSDSDWGPVTQGISLAWVSAVATNKVYVHSVSNVLSQDTWHHVAVTYDSSQSQASRFTVYVDGLDKTSTDVASYGTIADVSPAYTWIAGNQPWGEYLDGQIDDARIYNYALTSQQVKEIMNQGAVRFGSD